MKVSSRSDPVYGLRSGISYGSSIASATASGAIGARSESFTTQDRHQSTAAPSLASSSGRWAKLRQLEAVFLAAVGLHSLRLANIHLFGCGHANAIITRRCQAWPLVVTPCSREASSMLTSCKNQRLPLKHANLTSRSPSPHSALDIRHVVTGKVKPPLSSRLRGRISAHNGIPSFFLL